MSVIAVKKTETGFDIVSDNQATNGYNKFQLKENTDPSIDGRGKIFQVNSMTIGCAGVLGHIGMLQIFAKNHSPKDMGSDDILEWFMEFREWCNKKTGILQKDINIHGIMIKYKRCFTFNNYMESSEVTTFDAVGSGMWLAIGAMDVGASAEEAVRVAIKYDLFCGGDVYKISV